jgi:hypothetical protein
LGVCSGFDGWQQARWVGLPPNMSKASQQEAVRSINDCKKEAKHQLDSLSPEGVERLFSSRFSGMR